MELLLSYARLKLNTTIFWLKSARGWKRKTGRPSALAANGVAEARPLVAGELVIFAGVPFDDVGGGQRSAQLARCAVKAGRRVFYLYAYPRFNVAIGAPVESSVTIPLLTHLNVSDIGLSELFAAVGVDATLLFELPHRRFLPFLNFAKQRGLRTVYELIDDWDSSLGGEWFDHEIHQQFIAKADLVAGTAKNLCAVLRRHGRGDAVYLPNAANERIFDQYRPRALPQEYATVSHYRQRFIYFGSLYGEWFGWDYVARAATDNPDSGFFLIGEYRGERTLPDNVHLLGPKRIEELPSYLVNADAALLPFIPGMISDAVSPIKVFEYLFMGKRVVATPLPEIIDYPGVLTAGDPAGFAALCRDMAASTQYGVDLDRFIAANCWHARLAGILPSMGNFPRVTAVFLIHNNAAIIGRALESLILHCSSHLQEIFVVDNASTDGGGALVRERFPQVIVLDNPVNGCSSGRNLALVRATGDYVAFFDSDQWFTSGFFLEEALAILHRHAAVGAVGWAAGWFDEKRGDLGGTIVDDLPLRGMGSTEAVNLGFRTDIAYLGSGGLILPRAIAQQTGGFDIGYDPTCFEDTDFSLQLRSLGYLLAYRDLTGIQHQPHQTTNARSGSPEYLRQYRKSARYFRQKWANHPELFVDCPDSL